MIPEGFISGRRGFGGLEITYRRNGNISAFSAILALLVLAAGGAYYRYTFAELNRVTRGAAFERGALKVLPIEIGPWSGVEQSFDEYVVKAADVDDYLLRQYSDTETGGRLSLYIAAGVRARDLVPHRPEVCYPSHGMTLDNKTDSQIALPDGSTLEMRTFEFRPGGTSGSNNYMTVINYFIVDGVTCADVSKLRSAARQGQTTLRYVAQIQITKPRRSTQRSEEDYEEMLEFTKKAAPMIMNVLESVAKDPTESSEAQQTS